MSEIVPNESRSPFGRGAVIFLVGAGIVLALGFLLMLGFGDSIEQRISRPAPPLAKGATGFNALYQLVQKTPGGATKLVQEPRQDFENQYDEEYDELPTDPDGLLILTPVLGIKADDLDKLLTARSSVPTLVVLPKWAVQAQPFRTQWERRVDTLPSHRTASILPRRYAITVEKSGTAKQELEISGTWEPDLEAFRSPEHLQTIRSPKLQALIETADGGIVLGRIAQTETYILADPDLLNNQGLATVPAAQRALALLTGLNQIQPGLIAFDTSLHYRPGERNLIRLLFEPPFLAATIAVLAAGLLAGLASAIRFGPVRRQERAVALGKQALADNIAGLTKLAGRTAFAGPAYADAVRDAVVRRLRVPRGLTDAALADHLDTLTPDRTFSALDARLRNARNEAEMLQAAQALDDWRKEVTA